MVDTRQTMIEYKLTYIAGWPFRPSHKISWHNFLLRFQNMTIKGPQGLEMVFKGPKGSPRIAKSCKFYPKVPLGAKGCQG